MYTNMYIICILKAHNLLNLENIIEMACPERQLCLQIVYRDKMPRETRNELKLYMYLSFRKSALCLCQHQSEATVENLY